MPKQQQKYRKKTIAEKRRSFIWRWFVPGKHNSHRPTVVRWRGTAVVAAILVALQLVYNVTVAGQLQVLGYASSVSAGQVISMMNDERGNNGLPALSYNSKLTNSATAKAQDMFADDYWAHIAPDGKGPDYFIQQAGYTYSLAGENLAKGFQTSSGVVAGWMGSQGHKANVLGDYKDVGVAVLNGTLQGEETTLVVAHYGKSFESTPAPKPKPTPTPTAVAQPQTATAQPKAAEKKKESTKKIEKKTDTSEKKDAIPVVVTGATGGPSSPAAIGLGEQVGVVLGSNWAATVSLATLTCLLGVSVLSHHRAWLYHIRKHGIKLHWPTHIHHGAHIALIVVGAGTIILSVLGTVL